MTSINTVFKRVYKEALAPYGFVKIKGRQPYFVRMIGDEILQVITYMNEWSSKQFYKAFDICCGVATVYRQRLNLERSPLENSNWFEGNGSLYAKLNPYDCDLQYRNEILKFFYKSDDEESMLEAVKHSFEITEKIMLPVLNEVKDLETCMDYFYKINATRKVQSCSENFGNCLPINFYNEGLLHLKVYSLDEYIEKIKSNADRWRKLEEYNLETGRTGITKESFDEWWEDEKRILSKQIDIFSKLINDPEENMKAMEELERRKAANMDALRSYGFKV